MNPYKMFEIYGLNTVKKYQNQLRSAQPPWVFDSLLSGILYLRFSFLSLSLSHLFTIGNLAYNKMVKDNENQSILIM